MRFAAPAPPRFPLRVIRSGTVRVVFTNSEGQRWEAAQRIQV